MATLASRLNDLVVAIRTKLNTMTPRLLPAGGAAGQVLTKSSGTDYAVGWTTDVKGVAFGGFTPAAASQVLTAPPSPYAFSAATAGGSFRARAAATASSVFKLQKNGSDIGTVTWSAGATVGVVSLTTTSIAVDDVIALVAPATLDSTLAGISGRVTG